MSALGQRKQSSTMLLNRAPKRASNLGSPTVQKRTMARKGQTSDASITDNSLKLSSYEEESRTTWKGRRNKGKGPCHHDDHARQARRIRRRDKRNRTAQEIGDPTNPRHTDSPFSGATCSSVRSAQRRRNLRSRVRIHSQP